MKVGILMLFLGVLCGCKTTSLSSVEAEFDVGVDHPDMVRSVVAYAAIGSGWEINEKTEKGFLLSYSVGRHALTCDVSCDSGKCSILVIKATSGLKLDTSSRMLHKRGVGWINELKNSIECMARAAQHPFEVAPRALSVANGVDLKTVIASVCKSHGMSIDDSLPGIMIATKGRGPEHCRLKIVYEKMLYSIRHDRPQDSKTNGFQYDFLVRAIDRDVIKLADPVLAEMERRTDTEHADRQRMAHQLDRLADAVNSVSYTIRDTTRGSKR